MSNRGKVEEFQDARGFQQLLSDWELPAVPAALALQKRIPKDQNNCTKQRRSRWGIEAHGLRIAGNDTGLHIAGQ